MLVIFISFGNSKSITFSKRPSFKNSRKVKKIRLHFTLESLFLNFSSSLYLYHQHYPFTLKLVFKLGVDG